MVRLNDLHSFQLVPSNACTKKCGGRPERLAELAPTVPLGRAGAPQEVAAAIVWLLSPAASYVTGAILDVSGGR